jgi:hypothetical protein
LSAEHHLFSGINNTPFHDHQQEDTINSYINPPLCELALLLRPKKHYKIPLPDDVEELVKMLHHSLQGSNKPTKIDLIHQVFLSLWTRQWTPTDDNPIPCPTIRTLALLALKGDRSFKEAKDTTGFIAKFERAIRLTCLWEMRLLSMSKYDGNQLSACQEMQCWFTEKVESPFNSLRSLQHRASFIAYSTMSLPRIWWTDREKWTSMLYKGHQIDIQQIRQMLARIEDAVVDVWETKVLCGQEVDFEYSDHLPIVEDLTNNDVGYCFLRDSRNKCFAKRDHLLEAILVDPIQSGRILQFREGSPQWVWNKGALRMWLSHYADFESLLLARVEMLAGGPGRGAELTAMDFATTETRNRNLHMFGNHLTVTRKYHKAGSITGCDRLIPHSVDALTADLIIRNLAIARPFAELAIHVCFPGRQDLRELYKSKLFVDNLKEFTPVRLSEVMSRFSMPITGMSIGINTWRHIQKAWRQKLCPEASALLDGEEEFTSVDAEQMGHSLQNEMRIYGVSTDSLLGCAEDVIPQYLKCSTNWQVVAEVIPGRDLYHSVQHQILMSVLRGHHLSLQRCQKRQLSLQASRWYHSKTNEIYWGT